MSLEDKTKWAKNLKQHTQSTESKTPKETFFFVEKQPGVSAIMLDIAFGNGNHIAMPYAYLTKMEYDLSKGIMLEWGETKAQITGRNLQGLYKELLRHRVFFLRESIGNVDLTPETALYIQEIHITG